MSPQSDQTKRNQKLPPPSFTPASGRPTRPVRTPAIQVGETSGVQSKTSPPRVPSAAPESAIPQDQSLPASIPPRSSRKPAPGKQQPQPGLPAPGPQPRAAQPAPQQRQNGSHPARPQGAQQPPWQGPGSGHPGQPPHGSKPKKRKKKTGRIVALIVIVALLAWPLGLVLWANSKLNHIEALSGAANTPGTTYLIAGSDARGPDSFEDGTEGARADTIMLLHVPKSGPSALISLPRDIYVPIPGYNSNKINAAFSFGGAPLLVETVEGLTGMNVDHYIEIGFSGVTEIVDAVGGVELCLDYNVDDPQSELKWEAGCHPADGKTALAFARMRKADPLGDIGRAERQRQVVSAVSSSLKDPTKLLNPLTQSSLINAGTSAVVISEGSGVIDLGKMALAFRSANSSEGVTGTPPILSLNYRPGGVGSAVQLDEEATVQFFKDIAAGSLEPGEYNGLR